MSIAEEWRRRVYQVVRWQNGVIVELSERGDELPTQVILLKIAMIGACFEELEGVAKTYNLRS